MIIDFSQDKNKLLKEERGINFDDVIHALSEGRLLDIVANKNYSHQSKLLIDIWGYVCPFVGEFGKSIFLKTLFPSRIETKKYIL